jgi:hypothetical protein
MPATPSCGSHRHLGSISVITNETGAVVERDGYDAWGQRRWANGADDTNSTLTSQTPRGSVNACEVEAGNSPSRAPPWAINGDRQPTPVSR